MGAVWSAFGHRVGGLVRAGVYMHDEAAVVGGHRSVENGGDCACCCVDAQALLFDAGVSDGDVRCGGGCGSLACLEEGSFDVVGGEKGAHVEDVDVPVRGCVRDARF